MADGTQATAPALKALAALLTYPGPDLVAALPEIEALLRGTGLPAAAEEPLLAFCGRLAKADPLAAQGEYVGLFDSSPSLSLHLFQHVHGDSRERGAAMAALVEDYRAAGLELAADELPDFLPVFLEFASTRPGPEARALLGEIADVVALLAARLEARGTGYAAVMRAIEALASRPADAEAVAARLAGDRPDDTPEALDASWEEAPVSFMEPAASGSGEDCPKAAAMVRRLAPGAASDPATRIG
jgi:nitrate reductase delta subunit